MINNENIPEEDDLLGDIVPEIIPEKLFDEKEYATILLGDEGFTKKDGHNADFLAILINPKSTREEKDAALIHLKENKAQKFILSSIFKIKKPEQKAQLIAACWETGLDFSNDVLVFVDLINHENYLVSLEAFTVIQEMENTIAASNITAAIELLRNTKTPGALHNEALNHFITLHEQQTQ